MAKEAAEYAWYVSQRRRKILKVRGAEDIIAHEACMKIFKPHSL